MIRRSRVYTLAELATTEGKQSLMREMFPDAPGLHSLSADGFRALAACTSEEEWFAKHTGPVPKSS
jgi:hypothetical protein